jgi:hypothetical protein
MVNYLYRCLSKEALLIWGLGKNMRSNFLCLSYLRDTCLHSKKMFQFALIFLWVFIKTAKLLRAETCVADIQQASRY